MRGRACGYAAALCLSLAGLGSVAALVPAAHADAPAQVRKVAVGEFAGGGGDELRLALLEVLSQQSDLEVLGHRDMEVVAKRMGVGLSSPSDRQKLSAELSIFAWFTAEIDGSDASVQLTNAKGRTLGTMRLERGSTDEHAAQIREAAWTALGHHVSNRALRLHVLGQNREAAAQKLRDQAQELLRQREVALAREARRLERLAELRLAAQAKLAGRDEEGQRQVTIAQQRIAAENERVQREMEAERKREADRQRELAMERQRADQAAAMAKYSAPSPAPAQGFPAQGYTPAPEQTAPGAAPSAATQAWLQRQPGYGAQPGAQPGYGAQPGAQPGYGAQPGAQPGYGAQPSAQPSYPAPAPAAAPPQQDSEACPPTISETTCRWLQSRGGAR